MEVIRKQCDSNCFYYWSVKCAIMVVVISTGFVDTVSRDS